MERMTLRYCGENVLRSMCHFAEQRNAEPDDCISCKDYCERIEIPYCTECPIQKAFDRLAEYEDADEKIQKMYEDQFGIIDLAEEYIKSVTALNGGKEPRNIICLSDDDADKWKAGLIAACRCKDCAHKEMVGKETGRVYCPKTNSWRDADDFCKYAEKGDKDRE